MIELSPTGLPLLIPNDDDFAKEDLVRAFDVLDSRISQVGILSFPSTAERDAALAGLSSSDSAFTWITSEKRLSAWIGNGWATIWALGDGWNPAGYYWYSSLNSGVALQLGNGSASCRYRRDLDSMTVKWSMTRGSSTNTGGDNGNYMWRLPGVDQGWKAKAFDFTGTGIIRRANTGESYPCIAELINYERVALRFTHTRTRVHGSSFDWEAGDSIALQIHYEVQG